MVDLVAGHKVRRDSQAARKKIELEPAAIDQRRLRRGRLERLRAQMAAADMPCCVLLDPVNIRYACGARNMQVFTARNPARYLFVALEGPVVLFDFAGAEHLADELETIDEIRTATTASFVAAGPRLAERESACAREIAALARRHGRGERRLGIERFNAGVLLALAGEGFELVDAQRAVELARALKTPEEIACVRQSIAAVEDAVACLEEAIRPGISENALWSLLHQRVIELGGDYVETRLLSSGPRTNPWFQECGERCIEQGDLVALDTDVVGCHGYYCDFSRTFLCGDRPSAAQRQLYRLAYDQVHTNLDRLRPGMSFREFATAAWPIPEPYVTRRYYLMAHGVGMTGEYPYIPHAVDFGASGYDGLIEPGMTLSIESFIANERGGEGVKLEQQVLVTEGGVETLTRYPFESLLLDRES